MVLKKVQIPEGDSEAEKEKRYRLQVKHEININLHEYDINTGHIYYELYHKWQKYDALFIDEVRIAIHDAHRFKGIMTYYYDGSPYMDDKIRAHSQRELNEQRAPDACPIGEYYIGGIYKGHAYIVAHDEPCPVDRDASCFGLLFAFQFSLTPILDCKKFLTHQLEKSFENNIPEFAEFLDNISLEYKALLAEKHEPFYKKFIESLNPKPDTNLSKSGTKLNWLGTPSQFGHVLLELANKGFIELPSTNAQGSYSRYAKVCWDMFEFKNKTTLENLQKEMNPDKNTLSPGVRSKFTIPELTDISKKKKK